jgi:hypothetical protein
MAGRTSFGQISEPDFQNLLQALSATAKGRSFLAEYRRRCGPDDILGLLDSLHRIERSIASVRDQLRPERIADELRRVAMTLEIATDGTAADADGDETARRMALVGHARAELSTLAAGLAGGFAPVAQDESMDPLVNAEIASGEAAGHLDEDRAFLEQLYAGEREAAPER